MTKTYTTTIEKPKLVIEYDDNAISPREDSNLGYFITVDRSYHSPDRNPELETIVKETGEQATSQKHHIELISGAIEEQTNEKVLAIYPITKYEHGGVVYRLGTEHGFDNSNNGFYIVTDKTAKEIGVKEKDFERIIKAELEVFNKYANGDCYRFCLYNEQGEVEESCGGYYYIEDIRESLPEEWKDEDLTDYLK